jgi:hypothetical protein
MAERFKEMATRSKTLFFFLFLLRKLIGSRRRRRKSGTNNFWSCESEAGWPNRANFRPIGDCLFGHFLNYRSVQNVWTTQFSKVQIIY